MITAVILVCLPGTRYLKHNLALTTVLQGRNYFPHFSDEVTETYRGQETSTVSSKD